MERPRLLDLMIAAGFVAWALIEVFTGIARGPVAINLAVAVISPGALAWRRVAPALAALVCAGGLVVKTLAGLQLDGLALLGAILVAAYTVGRLLPPRRAALVTAAIVGLAWLSLFGLPQQDRTLANYPFVALWVGAPAVAGVALRHEVDRAGRAAERATRAEVAREQYAHAAVLDERLRIARELHDTVAHAVSVMVINAGAVRSRLSDDLAQERQALDRTELQGRQAILQLRRMLGVLRAAGLGDAVESLPTLAQLPDLVDQTRQLGTPVELRVEGSIATLDPGLELCAYRVVQEALTNVRKHAGAATVRIRLLYGDTCLGIRVVDDGSAPDRAPEGTGHGLLGIRERVELYGGRFEAGAGASGGFVVTAELPVAG